MSVNTSEIKESIRLAEEHRAVLHGVPEKAYEEHKTTAYVRKVCESYPVNIIDIGMETGLVCYLDAGKTDTVALRADIDAVPTENGPKHLCGHDAHAASLLGAMHYLCITKDELAHNVLFIFQPAEEDTTGAKSMLDNGLLDKVPQRPSRLFGIHNRPEADCGEIIVHQGGLMAEKSSFTIKYTGVAGHSSAPQKCIDPIIPAAALVSGIQTIVSKNVDPFEPVMCTVNSIRAGAPDVAVPEHAVITGYIRSFDHEVHKRMEERLDTLARGIADAYECKPDIEIVNLVPAVNNSAEMHAIAMEAARKVVDEENIIDTKPCMASEDFAVLAERIPAFFYWVGSGTPGQNNAAWHDKAFNVDAHYTETAVPLLCAAAMK
ncbi:MAG: M20 family metallopeptidase [Mogibacterium sp.]|nr:M20 family metallopeptidase [Mogibacterium sp.]